LPFFGLRRLDDAFFAGRQTNSRFAVCALNAWSAKERKRRRAAAVQKEKVAAELLACERLVAGRED
jgi:hypothetical protein